MIELDIATLALLSGAVIPLLVGVVTKMTASSRVKAIANLALSVGGGAVAYLVENSGRGRWQEIVSAALLAYIASGTSYHNLWKPTGVAPVVQEATASLGVG